MGEAEPVYQWVYRPEMQFSVFKLDVNEIRRIDNEGTSTVILPDDSDQHSVSSSDTKFDLKYELLEDSIPMLHSDAGNRNKIEI